MPRSLAIIVFLIIVIMAVHGAVLNRHQVGLQDEAAERDRQAAEEAVRAVARRRALDPQAAGKLAGAEIISFGGAGSRQGHSYAAVEASVTGGPELGSLLLNLYDADVGAVALTAVLSPDGAAADDNRSLPVIPLLVLARGGKGAFNVAFAADMLKTPLFKLDGVSGLKMTLGAAYAASGDIAFADEAAKAAQGVRNSFGGGGLWATGGGAAASSAAYARRLTEGRTKRLPEVIALSIDMKDADNGMSRKVIFKDASGVAVGEAVFTVTVKPPLLAASVSAAHVFSVSVGEGGTIGGYFNSAPGSLARLLSAKPTDMKDVCRETRRELGDKLGLGNDDVNGVLRSLLSVHGLFADAQDAGDCLGGEEVAASAPFADIARMDAVLGVLGAGIRSSEPEKAMTKVTALFADSVALYDFSKMWLGEAQVIPAATPGEAAGQMMSLPVARYACFSRGSGRLGAHRAALIRLEHDPALWVLDAAFDGDGKVAGIKLAQARQNDVCRAVGRQKSGGKACYFAETGDKYPGVDPAKC